MKRLYAWGNFGRWLGDSWFLLVFFGITLSGSAAQNIEIRLEGQIERRQPFPSMMSPLTRTGTVGRVELNLWDGGSSFSQKAGIYSFGNDRGSFATHSTTSPAAVTNNGLVRWKGDFTKLAENVPFTYTVNPTILYLVVPGGDATNRCLAGWKITVKVNGQEQMSAERVIEGHPLPFGFSAFGLTVSNGPIETLYWDLNTANFDIEYASRRYKGQLDLSGIGGGETFTVEYEMSTKTIDTIGRESLAEAYIGDPLDYGSGVQMSYGGFGELFYLYQLTMDPVRGAILLTPYEPGFYFVLCRRIGLDGIDVPVAMRLGSIANGELVDPHPPRNSSLPVFYSVKKIPLDDPQDADGDGIDDVYELEHASILNPVNAVDASEDPDADGYSNLAEFQDGTDPSAADPPPAQLVRFPGVVVPTYSGGELIDLNNDGVLDLAGPALAAALGNPGGTFRTPTNSPVPGTRSIIDSAFANLDGDTYLDALVVDQLTNRLFVLRGLGDGRFEPVTNYATLGDSRQIVICNLNHDSVADVAVLSRNGRGADLFIGNGNGTLTKLTPVSTNAFGAARGLALGDFNADARDDIVVAYASTVAVFLSTNGGYDFARAYSVGGSPESVVVGDLNKDGRPDIVTANRASGDLSVLLGASSTNFLPEVRYAVGDLPLGLFLADLNNDTFPDVVVSRVSTEYQTIFLNRGDGTLAPPYTVPNGNFLTAIIDWNADGNQDLFSGISDGGVVNLGRGDGTFATYLQIVTSNSPPTGVKAMDVNGDDRLELVGMQQQSNSIDIWEHAAVASTNRLLSSVGVGPYVAAFTSGDFNGDNLIDLAVLTQTNTLPVRGSNQVVILTNQGNFNFQVAGNVSLDFKPSSIVAGDFNGDGKVDLAVTLGGFPDGGTRLQALLGNGLGGFQASTPLIVGAVVSFADAVDVDGDLRSEMVVRGGRIVGGFLTNFLELYAFDASAGWTNRQALAFNTSPISEQVYSANGDAYPDLLTLEADPFSGVRNLMIYAGGPAGFAAPQVFAADVGFSFFTRIADLNSDGKPDVIYANSLFIARPTGGFYPEHRIWIGSAGVEEIADFNRDGKADLMSGLRILLQE